MKSYFYLLGLLLNLFMMTACKEAENLLDEGMFNIYYYDGPEHENKVFDENKGALNADVELTDLSIGERKFGQLKNWRKTHISYSSIPDDGTDFSLAIDGYHAAKLSKQHSITEFFVADAYLEISGDIHARNSYFGLNLWRAPIFPKKDASFPTATSKYQQSSVLVSKSLTTTSLDLRSSSFLEITGGVLVTNDLKESAEGISGMKINAQRKSTTQSDLWRLWSPSLSVLGAKLKSPSVHLLKNTTTSLSTAHINCQDFSAVGAVVHFAEQSKIVGLTTISSDSYIFFDENSKYKKNPASNKYEFDAIEIASLDIDGRAQIDANISIRILWSPRKIDKARQEYKNAFLTQKEFILVKATKLVGRTKLKSQKQAQMELGHAGRDVNYLEKFLYDDGKKLALEHDYTKNTITLKFVDVTTSLDADGCLPDIGTP